MVHSERCTTFSAERQGLEYDQSNCAETESKGSGITPQNIYEIELIEDSSASPKKDDSGPLSRSTNSTLAKLLLIFKSHKFSQGLQKFGGVRGLL